MITVVLSDYEWDHVVNVLADSRDAWEEMAKRNEKDSFVQTRAKNEQAIIDKFIEAKKDSKNGR